MSLKFFSGEKKELTSRKERTKMEMMMNSKPGHVIGDRG